MLLLLLSLSEAMEDKVKRDVAISVPIVFAIVVGVLCIIYWACYCNASRQHKPLCRTDYPRQTSFDEQFAFVPSYIPPPPVQPICRTDHSSRQTHIDEQEVPSYIPPPPTITTVTSTVPDESESCPQQDELPEAELHQGDAPPAYAEAVKMTTVIVIEDKLQNND